MNQYSATVFSVLDWEDAAWADPRFDLLMLCRKVCANMEQAEVVWSEYDSLKSSNGHAEVITDIHVSCLGSIVPWLQLETVHSITTLLLQSMDLLNDSLKSSNGHAEFITDIHVSCLGSIVPWLQLETVHSITTLLLQSMDVLNGGRNPWESEKDLWGKLQRDSSGTSKYQLGSIQNMKFQAKERLTRQI
jgi:hypothetical protein